MKRDVDSANSLTKFKFMLAG